MEAIVTYLREKVLVNKNIPKYTQMIWAIYLLEPSCCKKRQKGTNQKTGFVNRERLKVLNEHE